MWWIVLGVLCCLFFCATIGAVAALVTRRSTADTGSRGEAEDTPIELARKRLARGEITRKQFEDLKETLQEAGSPMVRE